MRRTRATCQEVVWHFLLLWSASVTASDFPKPELVLFSAPAGSELQPSQQFLHGNMSQPRDLTVGLVIKSTELYRSAMLDDLANALRQHNTDIIVVEMRLKDRAVASASFDVSDKTGLNISNWFTPRRLVYTTPFWLFNNGRSAAFAHFSILGHNLSSFSRSFYIHQVDDYFCTEDRGFMGIVERGPDPCLSLMANDAGFVKHPVMFYAKYAAPYLEKVVGFADQLLIYMDHYI